MMVKVLITDFELLGAKNSGFILSFLSKSQFVNTSYGFFLRMS